jgi:hypothetical protein
MCVLRNICGVECKAGVLLLIRRRLEPTPSRGNTYKVQISYRVALEDELIYSLCPANIYDPFEEHATQIIIKSAKKE